MEDAAGVEISRILVDEDGEYSQFLREFVIEPGGHTPHHKHPWFHHIIVRSGPVTLEHRDGPVELVSGDVVYLESEEVHQFRNQSKDSIRFFCLIPARESPE